MNFDVLPDADRQHRQAVTAGGIGLISVAQQQDKRKLQAAMDLARYLTSSQVGTDVPGYYLAPGARKSVKVSRPDQQVRADGRLHCFITPIIAEWPQIRTIIHPNIQNAVFGKITPEEAMKKPADEINALLAEK